jgi:predicted nucleic acid-binding protein
MTLTDAGPLIALIDADEPDHVRCRETLDELPFPLLTTWPAFTEAMHLLGRAAGWRAQQALWRLVSREDLLIDPLSPEATARAERLMETYADRPMDLTDATLVALAEERGLTCVFTLDSNFQIYRLRGRRHFDVVPG